MPDPCHEDPRLAAEDPDLALTPADHERRALAFLAAQPAGVADQLTAAGLARPAWYPPANRTAQFYGDRLASTRFDHVRLVVLHSTETAGMPGYQGGLAAPNLTASPNYAAKRIDWRHHFRLDQSSRALLHPAGTVSTNTTSVVQVECVGTTARGGPGMYLPDAPDWWIRDMAAFLRFMRDGWGVPLVTPTRWEAYPASYGLHNGVRYQTDPGWLAAHGVIAHQHVRNNDHGDVLLPVAAMLETANGDDMPTLDEIGKLIDAKLDAHDAELIGKLLTANLGSSGPNVAVALQSGFHAAQNAAADAHVIRTALVDNKPAAPTT